MSECRGSPPTAVGSTDWRARMRGSAARHGLQPSETLGVSDTRDKGSSDTHPRGRMKKWRATSVWIRTAHVAVDPRGSEEAPRVLTARSAYRGAQAALLPRGRSVVGGQSRDPSRGGEGLRPAKKGIRIPGADLASSATAAATGGDHRDDALLATPLYVDDNSATVEFCRRSKTRRGNSVDTQRWDQRTAVARSSPDAGLKPCATVPPKWTRVTAGRLREGWAVGCSRSSITGRCGQLPLVGHRPSRAGGSSRLTTRATPVRPLSAHFRPRSLSPDAGIDFVLATVPASDGP